jgi:uncharacterized protein (TIGR03118 family)
MIPTAAFGAVYKAVAFGTNVKGPFLYATNFRAGTIDVFDSNYNPASTDGGFVDPEIPAGFAPFGIQKIDGDLFVSYAKQNDKKHDDVAGQGNGFVDVFDTNGHLLRRFASRGQLNSPWGMTRASFAFGPFSGLILIGNFGDGRVNVFDARGEFVGELRDSRGKPLVIDGLWTLTLGGGAKSSPDTVYFMPALTVRRTVCLARLCQSQAHSRCLLLFEHRSTFSDLASEQRAPASANPATFRRPNLHRSALAGKPHSGRNGAAVHRRGL